MANHEDRCAELVSVTICNGRQARRGIRKRRMDAMPKNPSQKADKGVMARHHPFVAGNQKCDSGHMDETMKADVVQSLACNAIRPMTRECVVPV